MRYGPWVMVSMVLPLSTVLSNCGAYGPGFGRLGEAACPELGGNADALRAQYAANAQVNAKIRAFVQAAKDLGAVAVQIEGEAADACAVASARIDAVMRQGISVRATATPPQCQASVQAEAQCQGACDVQVDPGEIVAHCDPGRLSGYCQGTCSGRCEGRCTGACNGQCSARNASGQCVGTCSGDCQGSCDATCHARCQGTWQAPKCEGYVRPPSADAECNASCRAHANVNAS